MKKHMRHRITPYFSRIVLLTITCVFLNGCLKVNPATGKKELIFTSVKEELQIGKQAAPGAIWQMGGHYQDPELNDYISRVVTRLHKVSHRPELPLKIYVLSPVSAQADVSAAAAGVRFLSSSRSFLGLIIPPRRFDRDNLASDRRLRPPALRRLAVGRPELAPRS